MPLKSTLTRIPGIVFNVGISRTRDWKPGNPRPSHSAITSYSRSLPGAVLISHCHRRRRRRHDISFCLNVSLRREVTLVPFSILHAYPRRYTTNISIIRSDEQR